MRIAILGLAQAGKTALFKALCGPQAHAEAYGAHVGVARVPDPRLEKLSALYHPKKITEVALEMVDSSALLGEPEKDAGVFGQVRGADEFLHVVRVFGADADPARDIATLETEFLVSDLDMVTKRIEKVNHELKKSKTPELEHELSTLEKAREALARETPLRALTLSAEEERRLRGFMLLSAKPLLVVLNAGDDAAPTLAELPARLGLAQRAEQPGVDITEICGGIESELEELEPAEAAEFLESYGLKETARGRVLQKALALLRSLIFYTVGETECRAWLAPAGATAVEAAGVIHSDFAQRFIKAEVVSWSDLLECGSLAAAKEKGRVRLEGKDYPISEGEVLLIRHTA